jgi:hypothetical protein
MVVFYVWDWLVITELCAPACGQQLCTTNNDGDFPAGREPLVM